MKLTIMSLISIFLLAACATKVLVKKGSCVEVYDGALLECEKASK